MDMRQRRKLRPLGSWRWKSLCYQGQRRGGSTENCTPRTGDTTIGCPPGAAISVEAEIKVQLAASFGGLVSTISCTAAPPQQQSRRMYSTGSHTTQAICGRQGHAPRADKRRGGTGTESNRVRDGGAWRGAFGEHGCS